VNEDNPVVYHSLFEHRYVDDEHGDTVLLPYGGEVEKLEELLTENDEALNFEIDDSNENEITIRVYTDSTETEVDKSLSAGLDTENSEAWNEETTVLRHIAVGYSTLSEDPREEDRLMLALDGSAYDLFMQLTHVPNNITKDNLTWWLCNVCWYTGSLRAAITAIATAQESGFWDRDFADAHQNVAVVVWVSSVSTAYQQMFATVMPLLDVPMIAWLRDQYLAPLIGAMQELTCLFAGER